MRSDGMRDQLRSAGSSRQSASANLLRWPAFAWALAFALVHIYWLGGGRYALPSDVLITPGTALFYAALIAVPLLVAAGAVALVGGRTGVPISPRQAQVILGGVLGFCLLHAVPSLIGAGWTLIKTGVLIATERKFYALLYEFNWLMGGIYFLLAFMAVKREQKRGHRPGIDKDP